MTQGYLDPGQPVRPFHPDCSGPSGTGCATAVVEEKCGEGEGVMVGEDNDSESGKPDFPPTATGEEELESKEEEAEPVRALPSPHTPTQAEID